MSIFKDNPPKSKAFGLSHLPTSPQYPLSPFVSTMFLSFVIVATSILFGTAEAVYRIDNAGNLLATAERSPISLIDVNPQIIFETRPVGLRTI